MRAACLDLQDNHGADVNLALLALFLAARGRVADRRTADCATAACAAWTGRVTANLRAARRALKGAGHDRIRARIAAAELMAERMVLARLGALAGDAPAQEPGGNLAYANLAALIGPAADTPEGRILAAVGSGPPDLPV